MDDMDIEVLLFGTKICSSCGCEYPASSEYFSRDESRIDGLTSACRACRSARSAESYRRRKEAGRGQSVSLP